MISLDSSIIAAILVFLALVIALNYLLFQPLVRVQSERESRTTGLITQARKNLDHHLELFNKYQAAIKNTRMEGYRLQEQVRAEAVSQRAATLAQARKSAESQMQESRKSIQEQVREAKDALAGEALAIARGIAANILHKSG
jgi:F-type H+-transporting ATPase subunit b